MTSGKTDRRIAMKISANILKIVFLVWIAVVLFFYSKLYILPKIMDLPQK
jgi:hypothetical protein